MRSPLMGSPMPMWSMCAERTTYSFFSDGSEPGSFAMMLAELISFLSSFVLALREMFSGKCVEGMARAGEELVGPGGIKEDGDVFAGCLVENGIGEIHARVRTIERGAGPGNVHRSWVEYVNDADQA